MFRSFLFILFVSLANLTNAQKPDVVIQDDVVYFIEGKDSILCYQKLDKSFEGTHPRSNYIHPLYTLDGQVLTEDSPPDHPHQHGIFWAWHQLYIGDTRIGDAWDIKDFRWDVVAVRLLEEQGSARAILSEVLWKSPLWTDSAGNEKAVVKEITTIKVYPAEKTYRQIDIEISILALEQDMRMGGAENEKGYGGFSPRIRLTDDIKFTSSNGNVIPNLTPVKAGGWMDISGSLGKEGSLAGLCILCHPDNPGYPHPWILRSSKSMQNAVYPFPGANPVPLSQTQATVLRYRLLIHEGDAESLDISAIHAEYGKE